MDGAGETNLEFPLLNLFSPAPRGAIHRSFWDIPPELDRRVRRIAPSTFESVSPGVLSAVKYSQNQGVTLLGIGTAVAL
jgi:hypothetical protein